MSEWEIFDGLMEGFTVAFAEGVAVGILVDGKVLDLNKGALVVDGTTEGL